MAHTMEVSERGVTSDCSCAIAVAVREASSECSCASSLVVEAFLASWCSAVAQLTEFIIPTLSRMSEERACGLEPAAEDYKDLPGEWEAQAQSWLVEVVGGFVQEAVPSVVEAWGVEAPKSASVAVLAVARGMASKAVGAGGSGGMSVAPLGDFSPTGIPAGEPNRRTNRQITRF